MNKDIHFYRRRIIHLTKELLNDKVFLEKILKDGFEKANEIASKKIKKIHEIVGF